METFQHKLQNFNPGIVWLDSDNQISAMSSLATKILNIDNKDFIGKHILQFHPEKNRNRVQSLLDSAQCPVSSPPPMTMMINIPDKVLLIKISKMIGVNSSAGTCMIFYDLTDIATLPIDNKNKTSDALRLLFKLPVYSNKQVMLLDLEKVIFLKADGHYTSVTTNDNSYLCNLSIADLEGRLDPNEFIRVHRSYVINIRFAQSFKKIDTQCMITLNDKNETNIPISRSNIQMIKEILGLK